MATLPFRQVDVFSAEAFRGNPVAVIHEADDLTTEQMARIARWTNLSETTFLLHPESSTADYRLRIFTPGGELPFAGHPTLGSAHAFVEQQGGAEAASLVQECGIGLVDVRREADGFAFAAPPLLRSGPVDPATLHEIARSLDLDASDLEAAWVDNGPGWIAVLCPDADTVTRLTPDFAAMGDHKVGVVGLYRPGGDVAAEVRAFVPGIGVSEDPVTGSLNAGLARWLTRTGRLSTPYVAAQGGALGRAGRITVTGDGDDLWIGGATRTRIEGSITPD